MHAVLDCRSIYSHLFFKKSRLIAIIKLGWIWCVHVALLYPSSLVQNTSSPLKFPIYLLVLLSLFDKCDHLQEKGAFRANRAFVLCPL